MEWRNRAAINGIALYLVSTVFIAYLSLNVKADVLQALTWNALFWIIILFTGTSAIAKSFIQESEGRQLYMYSIASPQVIIVSKIWYNSFLMLLLSCAGFVFYALVLGNPVKNFSLYFTNILVAAISFSTALSMISAIASKASNSHTLMAILGFPVILPMLLMIIKISKNAIDGLPFSSAYDELLTLGAINLIVVSLSYILFPYLWRN